MKHFRLAIDYLLTFVFIAVLNVMTMWALIGFATLNADLVVLFYALLVTSIVEAIPFTAIMPWRFFRKH